MTAMSITVDVDGPAGLAATPGGPWEGRLTSRSERSYVWRGLERIVAVLERFGVRATFYVPGVTVEHDPNVFRELLAAGHEIAHHGHEHLPTHTLDATGERREVEQGLAVLAEHLELVPAGYRSPSWELTPRTLALLASHGFAYDSSLMGDDRPYRLANGVVELPVHWSLDDVPYFARQASVCDVSAIWIAEHDVAVREGRHVTYTIHPEYTGRGHRVALVERLLDHALAAGTTVSTHRSVAQQH